MNDMIRVHFYTCDCDWWTKYCDEFHRASALVARENLTDITTREESDDD